MPTEREALSARIQSTFQELSVAASDLNTISDEMGKCVADIDAALKKLNLGVTSWIEVGGWTNPVSENYEKGYIGYAKISGKWGIALSKVRGNDNDPLPDEEEEWLFNDGPRELRLEAIGKVPELFANLSDVAAKMTANVRAKLGEAKEVAAAIKLVAADATKSRGASSPAGGQRQ